MKKIGLIVFVILGFVKIEAQNINSKLIREYFKEKAHFFDEGWLNSKLPENRVSTDVLQKYQYLMYGTQRYSPFNSTTIGLNNPSLSFAEDRYSEAHRLIVYLRNTHFSFLSYRDYYKDKILRMRSGVAAVSDIFVNNQINQTSSFWFSDEEYNVKLVSVPLHTPLKTKEFNNYLPINSKVIIKGRYFGNYPINDADFYTYLYRIDEGEWKKINYKDDDFIASYVEGETYLTLSAINLFNSEEEAKKHIGKKVQIRVCSVPYKGDYLSCSDILLLTVAPSAPTLSYSLSALACSY
ncbi:hypothetical protein, partial [Capnocytophaga sp.]|uniref:hypothetical protein n=1 Tax=Capnocytophaga sp. TaxID=44737 RepID=UPI0026DB190E